MNKAVAQNDSANATGLDGGFHYLAYPEHILVATLDAHGQCDFVSPSWAGFTGRPVEQERGTGWQDLVHPEDLQTLVRGLEVATRTRAPFRLLYRYQRCDGTYRWLVNQGMVRTAPATGFVGHIGLCFDVTVYQGDVEPECRDSAQSMISLLMQTRLVAVLLDAQGRVQFANNPLCNLLESSATEMTGRHLFEHHLADADRHLLEQLYPHGSQNLHYPAAFETSLKASDNVLRQVSWHAMALRDFADHPKCVVLIGDDMTELRRTEQQVFLTAKFFEATHHAMLVTDLQGTIMGVNSAFTELTGYSQDEALGNNPRMLQSGRHEPSFYAEMWAQLLTTGHWNGDVWDRRKDGEVYPKYLSISVVKDAQGEATHYAGIFYDISERKTFEERLDRLAHYDSLTGLPNRCLLLDRLEQATERADRQKTRMGVLYLDLDHFKEVNDTRGHGAGDLLLRMVAQRLKDSVRAVDTVARLGGDEFVVLVPDIDELADIAGVASKILHALAQGYDFDGGLVHCTPSIGISIYPDDGRDIDLLIQNADTAMYRVKQSGRANFRFFHEPE